MLTLYCHSIKWGACSVCFFKNTFDKMGSKEPPSMVIQWHQLWDSSWIDIWWGVRKWIIFIFIIKCVRVIYLHWMSYSCNLILWLMCSSYFWHFLTPLPKDMENNNEEKCERKCKYYSTPYCTVCIWFVCEQTAVPVSPLSL